MESQLNRRAFLVGSAAAGTCLLLPAAAAAAPFAPTRFTIETRGSGPDVILIPGLASSRAVWRDSVAAVPGYRYHLVQLAGFAGEPARGNARGAIAAGVAEELARYAAAESLLRPALVGHSMGATVAMLLALRHPQRVGRLLVVDMLPQPAAMVGSTPDRLRDLADQLRDLAQAPGGRALVASLIGLFGTPGDAALRSDPDVVARALAELAAIDLGTELGRITIPMTIVYASPDARQGAAVDRIYKAAYRGVPGATFVRIDGSGHMIIADRPGPFRAALQTFLAQKS